MEFKASLAQKYEITSANSMIAAVNAFLRFTGLSLGHHQCLRRITHRKEGTLAVKRRTKIPKHELESIAKCFLPDIIAFFESEEGMAEYEELLKEQECEEDVDNNSE